MAFLLKIGLIGLPSGARVRKRAAVRGIIMHGRKILLVHTGRGDYKFPGGGMEHNETINDTLKREVREETGYTVTEVGEILGEAYQRRIDAKDNNAFFEMRSVYMACEVARYPELQQLDEYEKRLQFKPYWIDIGEAVRVNEAFIAENHMPEWDWAGRETRVLKWLLEGGAEANGVIKI